MGSFVTMEFQLERVVGGGCRDGPNSVNVLNAEEMYTEIWLKW